MRLGAVETDDHVRDRGLKSCSHLIDEVTHDGWACLADADEAGGLGADVGVVAEDEIRAGSIGVPSVLVEGQMVRLAEAFWLLSGTNMHSAKCSRLITGSPLSE